MKAPKPFIGWDHLIIFLVCLVCTVGTVLAVAKVAHADSIPHALIQDGHRSFPPPAGTRAKRAWVICQVWGRRHCTAALTVAWCESSLRPWAANGQYRGMFQMGSGERARWGHGRTAWAQARAARRYWSFAGGWGPWECQP